MAGRVRMLGGELSAAPHDGGFRVEAHIPTRVLTPERG